MADGDTVCWIGKGPGNTASPLRLGDEWSEKQIDIAVAEITDCMDVTSVKFEPGAAVTLGPERMVHIIRSFAKVCRRVKSLDFSFNMINVKDARVLLKVLQVSRSLQTLRLRKSELAMDAFKAIIQGLLGNHTVQELDLSDNNVRAEGVQLVSNMLMNHKALKRLDMLNTKIPDAGLAAIGRALATNSSLQCLLLGFNCITLSECQPFMHGIKHNVGLQVSVLNTWHDACSSHISQPQRAVSCPKKNLVLVDVRPHVCMQLSAMRVCLPWLCARACTTCIGFVCAAADG
jgi:hypothetical protein